MGRVLQAIVEARSGGALGHFGVEEGGHCGQPLDRFIAAAEDDRLAFSDRQLEVSRHEEVFLVRVAALLLLGVLDAVVPIGFVDELRHLVELHVEVCITGIHAGFDAVGHLFVRSIGHAVDLRQLLHAAEGHEGSKAQRSGRVRVHQRVLDHDLIVRAGEDHLLRQDHSADAIDGPWDGVHRVFADVLVTVGAETSAFILVKAKVEFGAVLDHGLIERREDHVVVIVQIWLRHDQQTVVFPRVAIHDGGAVIGALTVCAEHFAREGFFQVDQQRFVKFQVAHCIPSS